MTVKLREEDIRRLDLPGTLAGIDRLRSLVDSAAYRDPSDSEAWNLLFQRMAETMSAIADKLRLTPQNPAPPTPGTPLFSVGDFVNYHPVIGEPPTAVHQVRAVQADGLPSRPGRPVYWLHGKAGCVAEEALSVRPPDSRELWGEEGDERYTYTDRDEFIYHLIEDTYAGDLPDTFTVCRFVPVKIPPATTKSIDCDRLLESIYEDLDEDYGDWEDGSANWPPSERVREAAAYLLNTIIDEYTVFTCELVERQVVDVRKWLAQLPDGSNGLDEDVLVFASDKAGTE